MASEQPTDVPGDAPHRTGRLRRFAPLAAVVLVAAVVFAMGWHRELSLENMVRYRSEIDGFVEAHGAAAMAMFVILYVAVVGLSIPCALFMTMMGGMLFGPWLGGAASVVGATTGATLIFLIARTALGEYMARRTGAVVARLAAGFRKDAFIYLLFLRLVPAFPFFVVNLVPALAGVRLGPFVAATALGIVPATLALAFVGAGLDSIIAAQEAAYRTCVASGAVDCRLDFDLRTAVTPQLIAALVALGILALVPVVAKRLGARRAANPSS